MVKKVLLFLALTLGLFLGGTNVVSAQDDLEKAEAWGPSYDQTQMDSYWQAVEEDNCSTPSLECLVHQTSRFVAIEWVNSILYPGSKSGTSGEGSSINSKNNPITNQGGFVGGITYLMGEMYRYPAARTSIYVADVLENAHIITPAYAQGLGFASLNPVLELWKVFRNISYMLFVLIFIILGFMIMFRQKIGGQTAVTAQQAIPSVIVSLIFVTFSYAIAGFLIDLMYLVMFMIIGVFSSTTSTGLDGSIIDFNILDLMGQLFGDVAGFTNNIDIVTNLLGSMVDSEALGATLGVVGGVTLSLVLAVAILIGTFKLFFELLKSYATVVLSVVTAPLLLLSGAFPGKNAFGPWIKNIIANLSAFPTVLMVVILFYQFTDKATGADTSGGFIPPFLLGRGQAGAITTLMGLAIILALPEIVKDIKKNLGATEGFGTMVFNAAGARAGQGADLALPVGTAAGTGTLSGLRGAGAALMNPESRTWKGVWEGAKHGVANYDRKGKYLGQKGGMLGETGGLARGWGYGQTIRKQADDIKDGRLFQPDNYRKLLENIGKKTDKKAPPAAAKKKAGGQG